MPVHAFDQTRADIADFLVQNPGNFRFTTSIENDALTLSFHSSLPPSNDIADNDNIPSPAYSPVNWDELSVDLESAPSDPFNPQARAGSQASVGIPSADPLPNGVPTSGFFAGDLGGGNGNWAGESFFNSNRLQNLTETLSVAPTLSLGMDDDALPIIRLMPNGLYALDATSDTLPIPPPSYNTFDPPNVTLGLGHAHSPNTSFGSTFSHSPSVLGHPNATLMSNASFGSMFSHSPAVLGHPNGPHLTNAPPLAHAISTMANGPHLTNAPPLVHAISTMANGSHLTNAPPLAHAISTMANGSHLTNAPPLAHAISTMANGSHLTNAPPLAHAISTMANGSHLTNAPPLAHAISTMANGPHLTNASPFAHDATSAMTNGSYLANTTPLHYAAVRNATADYYSPLDYAATPDHYVSQHTATLLDCDTCRVLSINNEPCVDYDPTVGIDLDPNPHTDSLIPQIDAILDDVRVRDFVQEGQQVQEIKRESEIEEGEIINETHAYVPTAQNEHIGPFENHPSRSSTASTPPYASPSAYSVHNEALDVLYTNLNFDEPVKTRLSPIMEDESHSLSPPPTTGIIPYRGPARLDGRTAITFDGVTHLEAEEYLLTEQARYNDYHSAYIPNVVQAIESFTYCQDGMIANDWNEHRFKDGTYGGHPVIAGGPKLPTGGPRSGRTWHERVHELRDHRAHSRYLLNIIETLLSTRMLAEASSQANTIKCDKMLHIQGGLTPKTYRGRYKHVNPFFSESERKRLNSYAAIAEHHGEPTLASKIIDVLLMPIPDEDTVNALVESRLLEIGSVRDILRMALDRDLVLGIARTGLHVIPTSPFRSEKFEDPFYSKEWFSDSEIPEDPYDEPNSKGKKFFL